MEARFATVVAEGLAASDLLKRNLLLLLRAVRVHAHRFGRNDEVTVLPDVLLLLKATTLLANVALLPDAVNGLALRLRRSLFRFAILSQRTRVHWRLIFKSEIDEVAIALLVLGGSNGALTRIYFHSGNASPFVASPHVLRVRRTFARKLLACTTRSIKNHVEGAQSKIANLLVEELGVEGHLQLLRRLLRVRVPLSFRIFPEPRSTEQTQRKCQQITAKWNSTTSKCSRNEARRTERTASLFAWIHSASLNEFEYAQRCSLDICHRAQRRYLQF